MSEVEKSVQDFLRRWSRRKLAIAERSNEASNFEAAQTEGAEPDVPLEASCDAAAPAPAAAFDPASLPPVESIDAASDIRPFLARGVPIELTRAALRRAWVTDPTIRDFVGLAENQWDFTQPDTVPGFGSLEFTPELRRMVAGLFGEDSAETAPSFGPDAADRTVIAENSAKTTAPDAAAGLAPPPASPVVAPGAIGEAGNNAATQDDSAPEQALARHKHGGAMPRLAGES